MTKYLADDTAAIKARLEEIAAERRLALTGSTAEAPKETKEFDDYGMYAYPTGNQLNPYGNPYQSGLSNQGSVQLYKARSNG